MVDAAADGFGRLATATIKAKPDVGGPAALPGVQCDLWEGCLTLKDYIFTSESVSEGHPDKVCDRISDEVVDAFFEGAPRYGWDPGHIRVACETLATTNRVVIAGETRGPGAITRDYIATPDWKI